MKGERVADGGGVTGDGRVAVSEIMEEGGHVAAGKLSSGESRAAGTPAAAVPSGHHAAVEVDDGADAASRAKRRRRRDRLNDQAGRQALIGVIATLLGGTFWGFSGTCASFLFDNYNIDTMWLTCVRQIGAGAMFLIVVLLFDRERLFKLFATPRHMATLLALAAFGVFFNQFFYLLAVRYTNAGTATVLQCLQLVLIMGYACVVGRRLPRKRELAGLVLAFGGTFLIATGGDPTQLAIPPVGLAVGLLAALGAACMSIIPTGILPSYGSAIVTGSAMFISGIVSSVFIQPWNNMPALDGIGLIALLILIFVGSCLAYALYMQGVKDIGSVRASLLGTVEPISATVTSALLLGTVFAGTDIAGFALIIAMVFLTA